MTESPQAVRICGIVPAAGLSRRMGTPKQTLPYRGSTFAGTVVRTLIDAGLAGVVVVTRTELVDALDMPDDPRVSVAINDDPNTEMIDSIRIGLAIVARREGTATLSPDDGHLGTDAPPPVPSRLNDRHSRFGTGGVLVVPVDMPALTARTCRACISAFMSDPGRIVIATYRGKRGHPIIFPSALGGTIEELEGGLRSLLERFPDRVAFVEADDPGITQDLDTAKDLETP